MNRRVSCGKPRVTYTGLGSVERSEVSRFTYMDSHQPDLEIRRVTKKPLQLEVLNDCYSQYTLVRDKKPLFSITTVPLLLIHDSEVSKFAW